MLVLSRKRGEQIIIGQNIEVTIIEVRGDRVLIGVEAPMEVSVHRKEVFQRIQAAGVTATPVAGIQGVSVVTNTLNSV